MTEDEAKTKFCPASFQGGIARSNLDCRCVASSCMAWRWDFVPGTMGPRDKSGYAEATRGRNSTNSGFCGLAGKT